MLLIRIVFLNITLKVSRHLKKHPQYDNFVKGILFSQSEKLIGIPGKGGWVSPGERWGGGGSGGGRKLPPILYW